MGRKGRKGRKVPILLALMSVCSPACRTHVSAVHAVDGIRTEAVRFQSRGATLAGTLFIPDEPGRHPAIVLFHGSGPEQRNPSVADWFARHGLIALTYDKRGVGESTGDFRAVSFTDLSSDGLAAIQLLRSRVDVDAGRIGVWGLSQGGWLGPLAASRSRDVKFVIAVSGPGVSPAEQMVFYYASQLRRDGVSEADIAEASALRRIVWTYLSTGEKYEETKAALERSASRPWLANLAAQQDGLFKRSTSDILHDERLRTRIWFREEANYDPRMALTKLAVPALFVFGDADELVPVPASVSIIERTLRESGRRAEIKVFPGADHTIRVVSSGGWRVYAPGYLETMEDWLRRTLPGLPH
jgi:dienelactone hydrolase